MDSNPIVIKWELLASAVRSHCYHPNLHIGDLRKLTQYVKVTTRIAVHARVLFTGCICGVSHQLAKLEVCVVI
uniref:Uncharacterized protein n=1 Tax=Physcomitrium patens TaxID=3218 RepID=A0A2K1IH98_PHYPA|nr:hypothetical protein PHYPA_029250 [Physcomitrium patens]